MRSIGVFVAAAAILVLSQHASVAKCFIPPRSFVANGVTQLDITVDRDEPCTMRLGYIATVTAFRVTARPRHGIVGSAERSSNALYIAYKPNPGFVGSDQVVADVQYRYIDPQNVRRTSVVYNITVR